MRGKGLVKKHRERNSEREGGRVRVKGEVKQGQSWACGKEGEEFGLSRQCLRQHLVGVLGYPPINKLGAQIHHPIGNYQGDWVPQIHHKKQKKKTSRRSFSNLMIVGGQHNDDGSPLDSFLSLSYKCFANLRSFILVIVKQCILFNNSQGLIWLVILILDFLLLFIFLLLFLILKWWVY